MPDLRLSVKGSAAFLVTIAFLSTLWAQAQHTQPPPDRGDVGWLAVVRDNESWRITQVGSLLSPVKGSTPRGRKCNLQPGDQLVAIDGQSLSPLRPLGVAAILGTRPSATFAFGSLAAVILTS